MPAYNQFNAILSSVKRCFSRSPLRRGAMAYAKDPTKKGPRGGHRYVCAECTETFGTTEVQVDHIDPIVPFGIAARDMSWDTIINRTFCEPFNLQVLCKACHKEKSKKETKLRKELRDAKPKANPKG